MAFAPSCLSLDLEVGRRDDRIHAFAGVLGASGQAMVYRKGNLDQALAALDDFASGATFLLGHNLIAFDLPHLAAVNPELRLLRLPAMDTLRLNPLAFPRNPYHHLVKHYQDGQLKRGRLNDPELDARLTLDLFGDQCRAFLRTSPDLLAAFHWLTAPADGSIESRAMNGLFKALRRKPRPTDAEAGAAVQVLLADNACRTQAAGILGADATSGWPLAYALAWLSVSGTNSVLPPWVRHQFPAAGLLVRRLRDTPCNAPGCAWCREHHDPHKELRRWFGFAAFRPEPVDAEGVPLQQVIVSAAMRGEHVLAILPTGTGKSLCYQLPALSRYDKTGALTVVISPLTALMADQVAGLEARGITCCAALNGLLSMPERAEVLDRVRLGDIGILIVSPEQLRNRGFRKALAQREIGGWVVDEAHCLSKWGHDFRPDYRYVGRFIREQAGDSPVPPLLCLTATAKPDVVAEILNYFQDKLGVAFLLYDGGAHRTNLDFSVVPTTPGEKFAHIHQILERYLPPEIEGGAIVYCATRRHAEYVARFLREKGMAAKHFHAGLPPESKKSVQKRFVSGDLRVIVATNAFGMGIDKPDVRLVIHADIPGSLENYLQEAGRAGRDRQAAYCVLLYTPEDVERQFGMSAFSRLTRQEIQAILRSLKNLDRKKKLGGEVVATSGEILAEEDEGIFHRDSATDDTRVRTALSWLEESVLLSREENFVQVFPSSLRVSSLEEVERKLAKYEMTDAYQGQLLRVAEALIGADGDEGISTDELMGAGGLSGEGVRRALYDLERVGVASNDTALTAYVHAGVERSSRKRFAEAAALEAALIEAMQLAAPELNSGEASFLHLRQATQQLKNEGHGHALPEKVWRIINSIAHDGWNEEGGLGSLRLRRLDAETVEVRLQRDWQSLATTSRLRLDGAKRLLDHLHDCLPPGMRGTDLLAETTLGRLTAALEGDLFLKARMKDPQKLVDRALLWLHEQEVIRLNKGLAVFRPAMTIRLSQDRRGFRRSDFTPLQLHYQEQVVQIHVMAEYVQRGLAAMAEALRLTIDYFRLGREEFIRRWLPGREKELSRQTTPESWRAIVESLHNPVQQGIVADDREQTNVLVLAGPGSGKTRVLVHRIAYLVRVRREKPRGIVALAYNHHAAVEIRRRLGKLIGDEAKGVTVLTCHGLAMRLTGASFAGRDMQGDSEAFREVLRQAVALLKGEGLSPEEADEQRDRLLAGFRWILVDEYQDIGPEQYALISALAGRTRQDAEGRLSLFAVGDDDQNIYAFDGASVEFIRRFEVDYAARPTYLVENYRSTANIIAAANLVIGPAARRMKVEHPIVVNRKRKNEPSGGAWQAVDPVGRGRVLILPAGNNAMAQAVAVMTELRRLAALAPDWDWARAAVIAREWKFLEPVRSYCELHGIPVQMADETPPSFWRLRETRAMIDWLTAREEKLVTTSVLTEWLDTRGGETWWSLLREAVAEYALETGGLELPSRHFNEWLAEWGREVRRRQTGLFLLSAHRAKGLEFDHAAVLDGGWDRVGNNEDRDAGRRLYYVAMTRARETLLLARLESGYVLLDNLADDPCLWRRPGGKLPLTPPELSRRYLRLTPADVDLGFAGRSGPQKGVQQAIAALAVDDPLVLLDEGGRRELLDGNGNVVGRLARGFSPPAGMRCIDGRVRAIIVRRREEEGAEFQDRVCCDRWEVVLPELVFAPVKK
ncbi:MAG: RecQ family ATP-dependent DNA helicase [Desulfobulbaceae bacterium]